MLLILFITSDINFFAEFTLMVAIIKHSYIQMFVPTLNGRVQAAVDVNK
jgi:hypothetical protein